ncbi:MAG TPA: hypothetical protein VGB55_03400 [Tepidisphaeraceae bacterium]|jgi:hypothetical protein
MSDDFKIIPPVEKIETIAVRQNIRELENLRELFGKGRWRKLKGFATIEFPSGDRFEAELHWYEAHGIGKRKIKLKRLIRRLP